MDTVKASLEENGSAAWHFLSNRPKILTASLGITALLIPLLLGLVWGPYFEDSAYGTFHYAQSLASGGVISDLTPLQSPLYIAILVLLAPAMPQLGLVLSALGWGATAVVVTLIGRTWHRPIVGLTAATLVAFSPLFIPLLGSAIPWTVTLGWLAILYSVKAQSSKKHSSARKTLPTTVLLLLTLATHFDLSTVTLAAIVLIRQRLKWQLAILLAVATGWSAFALWQFGTLFASRPLNWQFNPPALLHESELYWLALPLLGIGLFVAKDLRSKTLVLWMGLLWAFVSGLVGSAVAAPVTAVAAILPISLGIEWIINRVSTQNAVRLNRPQLTASLAAILSTPLLLAQFTSLWQRYQARPLTQFVLEEQAAAWIQEHSQPGATLFASQRIGYLAQRATIPTTIHQRSQSELSQMLADLIDIKPDYVVSTQAIDWHSVTSTNWFRERYQPSRQFASAYAATSPFTVWEYTSTPFDTGEPQPANAVVPDKLALVGYKYEPKQIEPGDDVYLTLYLQATQPITVGFQTTAHLAYAQDDWVWSWQRQLTPHAIPGRFWQPGQVIPERIKLETEENIPPGAYEIQVSWHWANEEARWPIYQDNDTNMLDRVRLGYVANMPPVDTTNATPVNARFGDQITLSGFELVGEPVASEALDVVLYWQALRPPDDSYYVFVHLLDENGELIAGHDGQPMDNRYPTAAWRPGVTVEDLHSLQLPSDLPPGTYQLKIGLYLLQTGERLPVRDANGSEQVDRALLLTAIAIE